MISKNNERRQFLHIFSSSLVIPSIVSRESSDSFKYCRRALKATIQSQNPSSSVKTPIKSNTAQIIQQNEDVATSVPEIKNQKNV